MRTTIRLNDGLLDEVRRFAAEQKLTMTLCWNKLCERCSLGARSLGTESAWASQRFTDRDSNRGSIWTMRQLFSTS